MRRSVLIFLTLLIAFGATSAAAADPLILPTAKLHSGRAALLEVAAPDGATACRLSFRDHERLFGPYRVSLGGPTRLVRWKVGNGASGSWRVRMNCRGAQRHGVQGGHEHSIGTSTRTIVVDRQGPARGRLVTPASLSVGQGSIPEMPVDAGISIDNPLTQTDVDTHRKDEPFVPCKGSYWVATTRTTGEGVGTLIQFEPTGNARANAGYALTPEAAREDNPVYHEMWEDLNRCANFSPSMTTDQRHAMYVQMACHARWGFVSGLGGNTWDLEAWHNNVDWSTGLDIRNGCGRSWGYLANPATASFLVGRIVNGRGYAFATPGEEIKAWLVYPGAPKPYRRHITTAKAYGCLLAAGRAKASWFPWNFLDAYVDKSGSDITDSEACPSAPPPPGAPGKPPAPVPLPPAPAPSPAGPAQVYVEQQGSLGANTFTNPYNASGMGPKVPPYGYVEVSCKLYAPQIASANPDGYWYRIHSSPWNDSYYAVANTFWNGDVPGQKPYVHNTDFNVRDC